MWRGLWINQLERENPVCVQRLPPTRWGMVISGSSGKWRLQWKQDMLLAGPECILAVSLSLENREVLVGVRINNKMGNSIIGTLDTSHFLSCDKWMCKAQGHVLWDKDLLTFQARSRCPEFILCCLWIWQYHNLPSKGHLFIASATFSTHTCADRLKGLMQSSRNNSYVLVFVSSFKVVPPLYPKRSRPIEKCVNSFWIAR